MERLASWRPKFCIWTISNKLGVARLPCAPERLCSMLPFSRNWDSPQNMHRFVARFLLSFALAGNFVPLVLAATTAHRHACCVRKTAHPCHGSAASEANQLVICISSCCRQDCSRGVTFSQKASPGPHSITMSAPNVHRYCVEP